jgi:hypothetical protein
MAILIPTLTDRQIIDAELTLYHLSLTDVDFLVTSHLLGGEGK